ncbi:HAD family hydrolase [Mucilaginibacter kameinonensis]|nr:HAD family hydrolase [Mucilaginibacter kameinonensis]
MLQSVECAVAVDNALQLVKNSADWTTEHCHGEVWRNLSMR